MTAAATTLAHSIGCAERTRIPVFAWKKTEWGQGGHLPSEVTERVVSCMDDATLRQFSNVSLDAAEATQKEFNRRHIEQIRSYYIPSAHIAHYVALGLRSASLEFTVFNQEKLRYLAFEKGYKMEAGRSRLALFGVGLNDPHSLVDPSLKPLLAITKKENSDVKQHEQCRAWLLDPENRASLGRIKMIALMALGKKTAAPVTVFPTECRYCTGLERLTIADQDLRDLPDIFDSFPDLRFLDLSLNPNLIDLPPSFDSLRHLNTLHLYGTSVCSEDLERALNALLNQELPQLRHFSLNAAQFARLSDGCKRLLVSRLEGLMIRVEEVVEDMREVFQVIRDLMYGLDRTHLSLQACGRVFNPIDNKAHEFTIAFQSS